MPISGVPCQGRALVRALRNPTAQFANAAAVRQFVWQGRATLRVCGPPRDGSTRSLRPPVSAPRSHNAPACLPSPPRPCSRSRQIQMSDSLLQIGFVHRAHGLRGEVKVQLFDADSVALEQSPFLWLGPSAPEGAVPDGAAPRRLSPQRRFLSTKVSSGASLSCATPRA